MNKNEAKKIIALVPIKNEAYLLKEFLQLTLMLVDHVIIADQNSCDHTLEIAAKFPSTTIIANKNELFDNSARSALLIKTARKLYGAQTILLSIDADEFFCPSEEAMLELDEIRRLPAGTTLFFDKPSFVGSQYKWIQYGSVFPLGYVDDGCEYRGTRFHSRRIPNGSKHADYHCRFIKFAHLDAIDLGAMFSKRRLYSIRERDAGDSTLTWRWRRNSPLFLSSLKSESTDVDANFIKHFLDNGIDISQLQRERPLWWDLEALSRFNKWGFKRYQWDDIWKYDWERLLTEAQSLGLTDIPERIERPSILVSLLRPVGLTGYWLMFSLWRKLKNLLNVRAGRIK